MAEVPIKNPNFPQGTILTFQADRELQAKQIRALTLHAGRLGLHPLFDPGSAPLTREEIVETYARATFPTSPESFLGKEHFRVIGDDLEIPRRHSSRFFTHTAFPLNVNTIAEPSKMGLKVVSRDEAGMPPLEIVNWNSPYASRRTLKHYRKFPNRPDEHHSVVQAEGVIRAARDPAKAAALGILDTYEAFAAFGEELARIVGYDEARSSKETAASASDPAPPAPRLQDEPRRSATFSGWPEPVHDKLDELVAKANEADIKTNRSELAAALVALAAGNAQALSDAVMHYRKLSVSQLRPADSEDFSHS